MFTWNHGTMAYLRTYTQKTAQSHINMDCAAAKLPLEQLIWLIATVEWLRPLS